MDDEIHDRQARKARMDWIGRFQRALTKEADEQRRQSLTAAIALIKERT